VFHVHLLTAALIGLPGDPPDYVKPTGSTGVRYFEFLESNTHIIYPLLAVLVVVLIAVGVASALRAEELDGHQKSEIKRDIIAELRREVHGITVEQLAKAIGLTSHKAYKVLEEMASDNIVESRTDTRRHTTWRMKNF
jgi:hypothetical protein